MKMRVNVSNGIEFSWNYDDMPKPTIRAFFDEMEKQMRVDLTGFVIMCVDVWYGKGSNSGYFTRCGVEVPDFRIMQWSKNIGPIYDNGCDETTLDVTIRNWNPETRNVEVEFMDVNFSDINDMINWLRLQKNVFYTPPKDEKYEWVPKTELEYLKKDHKKKVDAQQKELRKYQDFFDSVCEELDSPTEDPEKVLEELSDDLKRLDNLEDFRYEICDILDMDGLPGTPRQTDRLVIERVRKLSQERDILLNFKQKLSEVIKMPEDKKETATIEDYLSSFEYTKKQWLKMVEERDRLKRCNESLQEANMGVKELRKFRDEVYNILDVGYPATNQHILTVLKTRQEKLDADGPWVTEQYITDLIRENSTKFKVLQPLNYMTVEERMRYVFVILNEWRDRAVRAEREYDESVKANTEKQLTVKALEQQLVDAQVASAKFRTDIRRALGLDVTEGTTNEMVVDELKERLSANDFYVEGVDAAEYRAFIMRLYEAIDKPVIDDYIHTDYLARQMLEEVKDLKKQNDRGVKYVKRMRELEQKLEDIKDICDGDSDILNIIGE